jgi:hypothetical protein
MLNHAESLFVLLLRTQRRNNRGLPSGKPLNCWLRGPATRPRSDASGSVDEPHKTCLAKPSLLGFSGFVAGVLCEPPSTEVVEKSRFQCQWSLQDFRQLPEQDCSQRAALKNATANKRPVAAHRAFERGRSVDSAERTKAAGRCSMRLWRHRECELCAA